MLADFQNSFTGGLSGKFATNAAQHTISAVTTFPVISDWFRIRLINRNNL